MKKRHDLLEILKRGFIVFPFAIFGMQRAGAPLGWQLGVAATAAALNLDYRRKSVLAAQLELILGLGVLLITLKADNLPRIYPFLMSATALLAFVRSWRGDGAILATYSEKFVSLTPSRRHFLRSMVPVWTAGLTVNTVILMVLVFCFPVEYWAWYSGIFSYALLAALFAWTICRRVTEQTQVST